MTLVEHARQIIANSKAVGRPLTPKACMETAAYQRYGRDAAAWRMAAKILESEGKA